MIKRLLIAVIRAGVESYKQQCLERKVIAKINKRIDERMTMNIDEFEKLTQQ